MSKSDQIMDALVAACETLDLPVEIDRLYEVGDNDCPRIVIQTGDEETAEIEGRDLLTWDRKWVMRPSVEFHLWEHDSTKQREALSKAWNDFLAAFKRSDVIPLMTRGSAPDLRREILGASNPARVGFAVDLDIYFDR